MDKWSERIAVAFLCLLCAVVGVVIMVLAIEGKPIPNELVGTFGILLGPIVALLPIGPRPPGPGATGPPVNGAKH